MPNEKTITNIFRSCMVFLCSSAFNKCCKAGIEAISAGRTGRKADGIMFWISRDYRNLARISISPIKVFQPLVFGRIFRLMDVHVDLEQHYPLSSVKALKSVAGF